MRLNGRPEKYHLTWFDFAHRCYCFWLQGRKHKHRWTPNTNSKMRYSYERHVANIVRPPPQASGGIAVNFTAVATKHAVGARAPVRHFREGAEGACSSGRPCCQPADLTMRECAARTHGWASGSFQTRAFAQHWRTQREVLARSERVHTRDRAFVRCQEWAKPA